MVIKVFKAIKVSPTLLIGEKSERLRIEFDEHYKTGLEGYWMVVYTTQTNSWKIESFLKSTDKGNKI